MTQNDKMIKITELINSMLNEQMETISKNSGLPIAQIKMYAKQENTKAAKQITHITCVCIEKKEMCGKCVGVCGKSFGSQDLNEYGECVECEAGVAMCAGHCGRWLDPQDSNDMGECGKCEYKRVWGRKI